MYYNDDTGFTDHTASTASGGGGYRTGAAGTVGFVDTAVPDNHLHVYTTFASNRTDPLNFGAVTIHNNATLLMSELTSTQSVATLTARELTIESTGHITADSRGFAGVYDNHGQGPGAGRATYVGGGGGGYGGVGASSRGGGAGGATYGSVLEPADLGSSGGGDYDGSTGGAGGGAIRLDVSGMLTLDGRITAHGGGGSSHSGGGSGGSIWVTTDVLTGGGRFQANGGTGSSDGSGGGGGRIAVYYNDDTGFTDHAPSTASGGVGYRTGGAGTVGFFDTSVPDNHLHVYTTFASHRTESLDFGAVTVHAGAVFLMTEAPPPPEDPTARGVPTLTAGDLTIESGGHLTADRQGYPGVYDTHGQGPGRGLASWVGGGGGGYGGAGGTSKGGGAGGGTYGSQPQPSDFGSSGGGDSDGSTGGAGGGAIRLIVTNALTLDGQVTANGGGGSNHSGGGSGGSIWATAGILTGTGSFVANGGTGSGYGGGGGGGRVCVHVGINDFGGTMSVLGGSGYRAGGTGTACEMRVWYVDDDAPDDPAPGDPSVSDPLEDGTPIHPFDEIQEGINAASVGQSRMVVVAAGTYPGNLLWATEPLQVIGAGADVTFVDADGLSRGMTITDVPNTARLEGFTFTGGSATDGGGLHLTNSSLSVTGNTFSGNVATQNGGGMYVEDASPTIRGNTFNGNTAGRGGGVYVVDSNIPSFENNVITDNTATGALAEEDGGGGICFRTSSATLTANEITGNNTARFGGGVYVDIGNVTFDSNVISGNTATLDGGGVHARWWSTVDLNDNTIDLNEALRDGGGVAVDWSVATLTGNIVQDNVAASEGGGVYLIHAAERFVGADTQLEANTIRRNVAQNGGGFSAGDSGATLTGNWFTDNSASGWGGGVRYVYSDGTLADNEFRGNSASTGGGAYLSGSTNNVTDNQFLDNTSTGDGAGLSVAEGDYTVAGNTFTGNVAGGSGGGIRVHTGKSEDHYAAQLTGNTLSENTALRGGGIHVEDSKQTTVANNVITGNTATGTDQYNHGGGGVFVRWYTSATVTGNTIADNSTAAQGGGVGVIDYCNLTFETNTITGNEARDGGGVFLEDSTAALGGNLINQNVASRWGGGVRGLRMEGSVENSEIQRNTALASGGGFNLDSSNPTITGNTIAGNATADRAGGLMIWNSSPVLVNNTITDNTTAIDGGGIYVAQNSSPTLTNNTIAMNTGEGLLDVGAGTPVITNSIFWGNSVLDLSGASATYSDIGTGNTAGLGNISADPQFVDAANGDYHVPLLSPVIDAGDNNAPELPATDKDGYARISGAWVDMGAYELPNFPPDPAVDVDSAANEVLEGAAAGTPVGITAQASDANADTLDYRLTDDAGGRFDIDSTTGVVTVENGSLLDGPDSHTITVQAEDPWGDTSTAVFTITALNARPTAHADSGTVSEAGPGVPVLVLNNDTDPADSNDPLTITGVDTSGTLGLVSFTAGHVTYDPNGQFESLNNGEAATDTFAYTISDGDGGTDTATVTITIEGVGEPPVVEFTQAIYQHGEDVGTSTVVTLTRDYDTVTSEVLVSIVGGTAIGGGTDYEDSSFPFVVTLNPGESTKSVSIPIVQENLVELLETIVFEVTAVSMATIGAQDTATLEIADDDNATVSITAESKPEGTSGSPTTYTFRIDLSQPADVPVTMTADTQDGSATAADDFAAVSGASVSFSPGSTTTQTVTVNVTADSEIELDEAFDLVLSTLSAGGHDVTFGGGGATETATADVFNDDIHLAISPASISHEEGDTGTTAYTYTVTRAGATDGTTTVDYDVAGTGGNPASAADFGGTLPSGTITFNPGETSKTITIHVTGDEDVEADEDFRVTLSSAVEVLDQQTAGGAIDLTVPVGATVSLNTSSWVTASYTSVAGPNNDYGDGGFSGGQFLRTGNGQANTITLSLSDLPEHTGIDLSMFVAQLVSVDPNRDGDIFTVSLDGQELLQVGLGFGSSPPYYDDVVSNFEINGIPSDSNLVHAVRTLTLDKTFDEHFYDFGALDAFQNIPHTSDTLTLQIVGRAYQGWNNEAYAIDNLSVGIEGAASRVVTIETATANGRIVNDDIPNTPPVADAGGTYRVAVHDSVRLDASGTYDAEQPDNRTLTYDWDLDGDGVYGETGAGAERGDEVGMTPTFDAAGLGIGSFVTVSLRVTDDGGLSDEDDAQIDVIGIADLEIRSSGITFSPIDPDAWPPINPDADELFTIDATVTNQGLVAVTGLITVTFYDFQSPVPLGTATIVGLTPGESVVVHSPEVSFPQSYRVITVEVDEDNLIDEMDEDNNEASQVVQVGNPDIVGAPIIRVDAPDEFSACEGRPVAVTGEAFYDFPSVPGTQDFPVQGAAVSVIVTGNTYTGSHTDVDGDLRQGILAPGAAGSYVLVIEVSDSTASAFTTSILDVSFCPTSPPPLPTTPPSGGGGYPPGGGGTTPGGGGGEPIPGSPPQPGDVFIYSEDIVFSNQPQEVGEPISIFAFVQYKGDVPAGNIPVTINDIFPIAGDLYTFPIGTSVVNFGAAPDESIFTVVEVPWINTAAGVHIIQVDINPPFTQFTGNDEATRLIYVGTPTVSDADVNKDVMLLIDADGDSVPSPGDTLHYTVTFTSSGLDDLNHVRIYDDYDERLLETPTNISAGGTVVGGTIVWDFETFAPASATVTFDAQIKSEGEFPGGITSVVNTAMVVSDELAGIGDWAVIEVFGDNIPPNTDYDLTPDPNAAGWNNTDVELTLTAYDNAGGSGVDRILYSIDGVSATEYTGVVTFTAEDTYTVYYQAIDVAGNYESPQSIEIRIDKTPPTAIHAGPFTVPEGSSIQLDGTASTDPLSGIQNTASGIESTAWAIDPDGLFDDGDPVSFDGIDGPSSYDVSLRVRDVAGNEVIIDTQVQVANVDPTITDFDVPETTEQGLIVAMDAAATDPAGVEDPLTFTWTVTQPDASTFALDGPSVSFFPNIPGSYTLDLEVTDGDGGSDSDSATLVVTPRIMWYVDDDAANDPAPNDNTVSDPFENGSPQHPWDRIQEGIDAAGDGNTVIVAAGLYPESLTWSGKSFDMEGAGRDVTTVDPSAVVSGLPAPGGRVLAMWDVAGPATIEGFTFTGGSADWGGGIRVDRSSIEFTDNAITNNATTNTPGGGMYLADNPLITLTGNLISDNTSARQGGGVYSTRSTTTFANNTIEDNQANWDGGGLYLYHDTGQTTTLTGNDLLGNTASVQGGGAYVRGSTATVSGNTVTGNTATHSGGGMFLDQLQSATVDNNTFTANNAGYTGGGLWVGYTPSVTVTNNTVTSNWSDAGNAGLSLAGIDTLTMEDNRIESNDSDGSGGGVGLGGVNGILARNVITDNEAANAAGVAANGCTLEFIGNTITYNTSAGDAGGMRAYNSDLTFTDNDITHNTSAGGGAGVRTDRTSATFIDNTITDNTGGISMTGARGVTLEGNVISRNIGRGGAGISADAAYDVTAIVTGNTITDNQSGGWSGGGLSLAGALSATIENNIVTGNSTTGNGGGLSVVVETDLIVRNNTVTGNHSTQYEGGMGLAGDVLTLEDNRIEDNSSVGNTGGVGISNFSAGTVAQNVITGNVAQKAGGINIGSSTLVLTENTITNNTTVGPFGWGGGGYAGSSTLTFTANDISQNTAEGGGAGLRIDNSTATFVNNTITDNVGGAGVELRTVQSVTLTGNIISRNTGATGVAIGASSGSGATATVIGNTITDNETAGWGGGLNLDNLSVATIEDNVITGNVCTVGGGGGLRIINSTATVRNNTISANQAQWLGGGIQIEGSAITVENNQVDGNTSAGSGGGIFVADSTGTLTGNVVTNNQGNRGGGLNISGSTLELCGNTITQNAAVGAPVTGAYGRGGGLQVGSSAVTLT